MLKLVRIAVKNIAKCFILQRKSMEILLFFIVNPSFFDAILTNFNSTENIFPICKKFQIFYKVKANLLIDIPTPYEVLEWSGKSRNTMTKYHHFCFDLSYFA